MTDRVYKVRDRATGKFMAAGSTCEIVSGVRRFHARWTKTGKTWNIGGLKCALKDKTILPSWEILVYEPVKYIACSLVVHCKLSSAQVDEHAISLKK